jgi:dolichol-phosphate mannosyltransferase
MKDKFLSIIIPAHNEAESIESTILDIIKTIKENGIPYEIVVVNDNSTDSTQEIVAKLSSKDHNIKLLKRKPPKGFGRAVRDGLDNFSGDYVVICMGDASDTPEDIVRYYQKLEDGYDCAFGSRFIKGAIVRNYPLVKLFFNRVGNIFIKYLFGLKYNDISNAFKAYRKEVIEEVMPLVSNHFNITVEIPLKAVVRGFSYAVLPINWYGRTSGVSKHSLKELQKKYFFSIFYVWLEKILLKEEMKHENTFDKPRNQ